MHFELLDLISGIISIFILFSYFGIFFDKKKSNIIGSIVCLCFVVWQLKIGNSSEIIMYIKLFINMVLIFLICTCCYKGKWIFKLIVSVLICSLWTLMEFLIGYVFILLDLKYSSLKLTGGFMSKILTLFLILGLKLSFKRLNIRRLPIKYGIMLLLIPVGSIYMIYNLFNISVINRNENTIRFCLIGLIIILLINLLVFRLCSIIAAEFELRRNNTLFMRQLELHNKYMQEREEQIQLLRTERHDTKQRYCLLHAMLKSCEYKEVEDYLEELLSHPLNKNEGICKSDNWIVDSLINGKLGEVKKQGVDVEVSVHVPQKLPYEIGDLGILLGNVIDNAIEAVEKCQMKKYIKLFIEYQRNGLLVVCINSYDGFLKKDSNGNVLTRKENPDNHGFGLFSIETVANKYSGSMVIEPNELEFKIKIYMGNGIKG